MVIYFSPNALNAQNKEVKPQPVFDNLTTDDGLPSNEIYHAIQDSLGYIWFATNNGVSRYNGYYFENFGLEDGLVDNTIYEIYSDYRGRIWFISHIGNLVYYENGNFSAYPYNNKIQKLLPATRGPIKKSFYVDRSDNVHISFKKFGRLKISPEGLLLNNSNPVHSTELIVEQLHNDKVILTNPLKPNGSSVTYIDKYNNIFNWRNSELFEQDFLGIHMFGECYKDILFLGLRGYIIKFCNNVISKRKLGVEIIWLNIDDFGRLWVSPVEGGVYCYNNADLSQAPYLEILKKNQITSVLKDNENGYWFTSLNDGVFYCSNINAKTYLKELAFEGNNLNNLYIKSDTAYLGFDNGKIGILINGKISFDEPSKDYLTSSTIRDFIEPHDKKGILISSTTMIHRLFRGNYNHYYYSINNFRGIMPRQIIKSFKGDYIIASTIGLKRFDGNKITYDSYFNKEFMAAVYAVFEKPNGNILMGCANGLWEYDGSSFSYLGENTHLLSKQILTINSIKNGPIFIGTKGLGLVVLMPSGEILNFTKKDGLKSNTINQVLIDESSIWIANNEGAHRIIFSENFKFQSIISLSKSNGLPINEVQKIFKDNKNIYIATKKGLTIINEEHIQANNTFAFCHITKVRANNIEKFFRNGLIQLNYNENLLNIDFIGLSYLTRGKVNYRYRLIGADSTWLYTNSNSALFSNLKSYNYTFEVQAQNNDGIWSPSQKLEIHIKKPYWQTSLFIVFVTIAFSVLLFSIYRIRIQSIRKRNELLNTTNLYKQQALRQQMNPHFIFNTLNSIQLFILENDPLNSHKYLTKFARLIRMTLDNSQETKVSVKDEIEALKLYLELESLRLEGKFTFNINVAHPEILGFQIPTLLIQPFVENAIWHGIMMKKSKAGHVNVTVERQNEYLICQIEDDGIGRKAAIALNKKTDKQHKSLGYKITAQRIELLNTIYRDSFSIEYDDLINTNGEPTGTKVTIRIPI